MALQTSDSGVRAGQRECSLRRVIENGSRPVGRRVAERTILRESGGGVRRIIRSLIVLQMARIARHRKALIHAIRMALQAGHGRMRAGERESGLRRVVEDGSAPIRGRVAELAILRESGGRVGRIIRALVVLQMTGIACRGQALIDAVRVALETSQRGMGAGQREGGLGRVIEDGSGPIRGRVTQLAILRETGGRVGRIIRALVVLQMTGIARGVERRILTIGMALDAGYARVGAGKREPGVVVIEARRRPGRGGVADLAILREPGRHVIRVHGGLIILGVTARTRHVQAGVDSARMALQARDGDVRPGQGEFSLCRVIEDGAGPVRGRMAERAILRESGGRVRRVIRSLVILQMT